MRTIDIFNFFIEYWWIFILLIEYFFGAVSSFIGRILQNLFGWMIPLVRTETKIINNYLSENKTQESKKTNKVEQKGGMYYNCGHINDTCLTQYRSPQEESIHPKRNGCGKYCFKCTGIYFLTQGGMEAFVEIGTCDGCGANGDVIDRFKFRTIKV